VIELFSPLVILCAIIAVTLTGLGKGGLSGIGMLATPLLASVIPPVTAAAIMLPVLIVQDAFSVWNYRRDYDLHNLLILVPSGVVGIVAGYLLAAHLSQAAVALALGAISIVFSLRSLLFPMKAAVPVGRPSTGFGWLCGMMSGFTSMIAHAGGPPFQIYVMPQRLARDIFVGTGVILFGILNVFKVVPYVALGQLTTTSLYASLLLAPLAIAATYAGIWLVRRIDQEKFYTITYVLLALVGLKLCWDGVSGLLI
jgi:uncharacterized membrane protein YfcA